MTGTAALGRRQAAILAHLREHPGLTATELARAFGLRASLFPQMEALEQRALVVGELVFNPGQVNFGVAAELCREYPFLGEATAERLARSYGSHARKLLGNARSAADLGRDFGRGLSEAELRWAVHKEWARTAEDVLWRRTKLGLLFTPVFYVVSRWVAGTPMAGLHPLSA